jgi:carboxyl-terminal processing protease
MQVWGTVKYNFVFFGHVPDLDWDAAIRSAIPRVLAADDREEYFRRLNELTALLHDGHTLVLSPSLMNGENDNPPVEFQKVENVLLLLRSGGTEEIRSQGVREGMELVAVGGTPALSYLQEKCLRYYPGSTPQNGEAFGMFLLLNGPKDSKVEITLKDASGKVRSVTLTRNSRNRDGSVFKFRVFETSPLVESRMPKKGIGYLRIATFDAEQVVEAFNTAFDKFDLDGLEGLILDLRTNMGGDDSNAFPIVSRLVDRPTTGATWSTRVYRPAFASWSQPERTYQGDTVRIEPSGLKRYKGPLVILIGPNTMSTSEDFIVPLDFSGRALLVGEATAGTTGNPVNAVLPGGAILRVCSKHDTYPDGSEFVGRGIAPDIVVLPTVAGIRARRDEVLEKAVEALGEWDRYKALTAYKKPQ